MAAPASHPAFPRDAWPTIELKRMPNGEMGVMFEFPATPEMVKMGVDIFGFVLEPRRVETMHTNIADVLDALGLIKSPLKLALERYSNNPLDLVALSDARGEVERLKVELDKSFRNIASLHALLSQYIPNGVRTEDWLRDIVAERDRLKADLATKNELLGGFRG